MKIVKCNKHKVEFAIPTTDEEFVSGQWHEDVMYIQTHIENFPQCKLKEKKTQN